MLAFARPLVELDPTLLAPVQTKVRTANGREWPAGAGFSVLHEFPFTLETGACWSRVQKEVNVQFH
jgi:hypothetical protein